METPNPNQIPFTSSKFTSVTTFLLVVSLRSNIITAISTNYRNFQPFYHLNSMILYQLVMNTKFLIKLSQKTQKNLIFKILKTIGCYYIHCLLREMLITGKIEGFCWGVCLFCHTYWQQSLLIKNKRGQTSTFHLTGMLQQKSSGKFIALLAIVHEWVFALVMYLIFGN